MQNTNGMNRKIILIGLLLTGLTGALQAQPVWGLDSIDAAIGRGNPSLKYSDALVRSLDAAAPGARSWPAWPSR